MDARDRKDFSVASDAYGFTIFYHGVPIFRQYTTMKEMLLPVEAQRRTDQNHKFAERYISEILRGTSSCALIRADMIDRGYQPSESIINAVLNNCKEKK